MKKIIGIAPAPSVGTPEESCMADHYRLGVNYIKRTAEAGCVPMGLAPVDHWLSEEALDACDGFLVQGGAEFYPYHFQIIHHAYTHGKRYLGVCLGQQLIYVYFELRRRVEERGYTGDLVRAIDREWCVTAESAKTLTELGMIRNTAIKTSESCFWMS